MLNALSIGLLSLVPGILWVWYFVRHDRHREPTAMLARAFVAGMIAVVPAALLERPLYPFFSDEQSVRVMGLLAIGLIEDGVKLSAVYVAVFHSEHFDEPIDGIVYAVSAALGFAVVENAVYTLAFGRQVALMRAVITSLAHASFAGVFGMYLGWYKARTARARDLFKGFLLAAGLHATYDLLVSRPRLSAWPALLLLYAVYRYVLSRLQRAGL